MSNVYVFSRVHTLTEPARNIRTYRIFSIVFFEVLSVTFGRSILLEVLEWTASNAITVPVRNEISKTGIIVKLVPDEKSNRVAVWLPFTIRGI